jgi:hypothetical protein
MNGDVMNDRDELCVLVSRLGRWLDEKSPGNGSDLFTEGVEAHTQGGVAEGVDAVIEQARRNHNVPTQHFITDPLVAVDGDRAVIGANLLVVFAREGGPRILGERYDLEAARTRDGWRLSRIQARQIWEVANV